MTYKNTLLYAFCLILCLPIFISSCKENTAPTVSESEIKEVIDTFDNGVTSRKYTTKNGIMEGQYQEFYSSGELKVERNFINGKEEGKTTFYYKSGQIQEVQYITNGRKNGGDTVYYEDGSYKFINQYFDGLKNGHLQKWDEDGELTFDARFSMDTLIEVEGKPVEKTFFPRVLDQ